MMLSSTWDSVFPLDTSNDVLLELALNHLLDCTSDPDGQCSDLLLAVLERDFTALCTYSLSYNIDSPAFDYLHLRQALGFFSKNVSVDIGVNRRQVAMASFLVSEADCLQTNMILKKWARGNFSFPRGVDAKFHLAQRKIARLLGPVPSLSEIRLRFGKGSTTLTKKRFASPREKLHAGLACSEDLIPVVRDVLDEMPLWTEFLQEHLEADLTLGPNLPVRIMPGKVTFVPKSAKTERTVVTEPPLNGMVQLGYEGVMSQRLRAAGIDISDQTLNQRLAKEGSLTGALATLDLSSASDTISNELVWHLLPFDWAQALSYCRTSTISVDGQLIRQEKFSSMGNGCTFPLETLIFWGLTRACCDDDETVSVYGDDIICPSHRSDAVSELLRLAGFKVNLSKSFSSGPFRESCGADFYKGIDIRPFYQKDLVGPSTLFSLHNFYKRELMDDYAELVATLIHPALLIYGPDGYGDGHLIGVYSPKPHKRHSGYSGFIFHTFTWKKRRDVRPAMPGDYILPLYSIYLRDSDIAPPDKKYYHGVILDSLPPSNLFPGKEGYKMISIYTLIPA
jgi:hypothetical protein